MVIVAGFLPADENPSQARPSVLSPRPECPSYPDLGQYPWTHIVGAGEQGCDILAAHGSTALMESAHPPLPTRLPARRYRGNLPGYLERLLLDSVRYLEAALTHADLRDALLIVEVLRRLHAQIRRSRDRHRTERYCAPCRRHAYLMHLRGDHRPSLYPTNILVGRDRCAND